MLNKTLIIAGLYLIVYGFSATAWAQDSSSPNFRLREQFIGSGGTFESGSASYQYNSAIGGGIAAGETLSASYRANIGFHTTNEPRLVMIVDTHSVNFGQLSTAATITATSTFSVLNYTAHGYAVFSIGSPPSIAGHTLAGINPTATPQVGVEQFGINLRANTLPVSFGTDPIQVPSSGFSFGTASAGYNVPNHFRYVTGEQIAGSNQTSGQTDFTIAYIVNTSNTTPAGQYRATHTLVVVGTY